MALDLHAKCKERLVEKIAEQLPNISVQNNMFIDRKSAILLVLAESVLPERGPAKDKLEQYIGEAPIFEFIYEFLAKELNENQKYDSKIPDIKLTELDNYKDPVATANRLVDLFESLPWKYTLSIKFENEFSEFFSENLKKYELGDSLRVVTPDEDFTKSFPLQTGIESRDRAILGIGLLSIFQESKWDEKAAYLQIETEGFIGHYGGTTPLDDSISILKQFCGLGIALRLFDVNYTYKASPVKSKFYIHQKIDEKWVIQKTKDLETSISETFSDLVINNLNGQLDSDEKKLGWIKSVLVSYKNVFSNQEKSQKILLGAQWLFDSYCGKNELLSFVQTTVVLEILLGEKVVSDIIGLGELLRNRCAYLIGTSHEQRKEILDDFKIIYDVRSKIVHRGKSRLTYNERSLFSKLQWMCRRVIQEEVKLLEKDLKKKA